MNNDPSVEELKRESERTRACLASTVVELRQRVGDTASEIKQAISPDNLKREVKAYVREEQQNLTQSLLQRARDNPLQALAVGAAIAYPTLGLLRAIPVPLALIGAGIWLTSAHGKRTGAQMQGKADAVLDAGKTRASELADDIGAGVTDKLESAKHGMQSALANVQAKVGGVVDTARGAAGDIAAEVTERAENVVQAAQQSASAASDTAADLTRRTRKAVAATTTSVETFMQQNPLLVAGISAAIGAFLAASLPASRAERQLLSGASGKVRDKAREIAGRGIDKARTVAGEIVDEVAASAKGQGLSGESLADAADTVVEKAKLVADRGVAAAFPGHAPETTH